MFGRYRFLLSSAAATFAVALATAGSAQDRREAPLGDLLGTLKTIEVDIGGEAATMILDTGGGLTVVTPEFANRIGCSPWGQLSGFRLSGERLTMARCGEVGLRIAGEEVARQELGVFDLTPLLPSDAPDIDGILSLDALADTPFTLELGRSRLTFENPESLAVRTAEAVEIPIRFHRQAGGASLTVMIQVLSARGLLWMQLDAGSDAPLLIPPSSAAALGLDLVPARQQATLTLGTVAEGVVQVVADARVRDMIIDGNIGIPVMRKWVLTFDLSRSKLWIRVLDHPQAQLTAPPSS